MTATNAGHPFWAFLSAGLALLSAGLMARALLHPDPGSILSYVKAAYLVLVLEAVMLAPLAVFAGTLHGRHRLASRLALAGGLVAGALCLWRGAGWLSLLVALRVHARIAQQSSVPDPGAGARGDWAETGRFVASRGFLQFCAFVLALLVGNFAADVLAVISPEARGLLRAAGKHGGGHGLLDVVGILFSCAVYYLLTAVNELVRLPGLLRARPALENARE